MGLASETGDISKLLNWPAWICSIAGYWTGAEKPVVRAAEVNCEPNPPRPYSQYGGIDPCWSKVRSYGLRLFRSSTANICPSELDGSELPLELLNLERGCEKARSGTCSGLPSRRSSPGLLIWKSVSELPLLKPKLRSKSLSSAMYCPLLLFQEDMMVLKNGVLKVEEKRRIVFVRTAKGRVKEVFEGKRQDNAILVLCRLADVKWCG